MLLFCSSEWWSKKQKARECGMCLVWTLLYTLTPEGAAFLQQEGSCCQYSLSCHGQLKTFPHTQSRIGFAFLAEWFSKIYSCAMVLIGCAPVVEFLVNILWIFNHKSGETMQQEMRNQWEIWSFKRAKAVKMLCLTVAWSQIFLRDSQSRLRKALTLDVLALDFSQILQMGCFHAIRLRSIKMAICEISLRYYMFIQLITN